ncbi:MAG: hypothetical protein ACOH1T_01320 [Microbacteriaceae bacterium]
MRRPLASALGGLLAVALGLGLSVVVAAPALAADEIRVSADGATWSSSYPGTLFGSQIRIVPGASEVSTFYVRNSSPRDGYLRISLRNVDTSDPLYADSLSVSASIPGNGGRPQPLSAANSCIVLLDGPKLAAGATVPVSTVVALANLVDQQSQGSSATFSVHVALSDVLPGVLSPTACSYAGITIPATPPANGSGTAPEGSWELTPGYGSIPESSGPQTTDPGVDVPTPLPNWLIDPNTARLYEELFWFVMLGAFVLGVTGFILVAKRRRREENNAPMDAAT